MALFGTKKEKAVKTKAVKVTAPVEKKEAVISISAQNEIIRPRITEKSGMHNEAFNIYTFEVANKATKHSIARAIKGLYKVTPIKVRTINLPRKAVFIRGKNGMQPAVKKALVFLKKGDKIEFA